MKTNKQQYRVINLSCFRKHVISLRIYSVVYVSPVTGKRWRANVADMELLKRTVLSDAEPTQTDLRKLRAAVKKNGKIERAFF